MSTVTKTGGVLRLSSEAGAVMIRADAVTAVFHTMVGPALVTCVVSGGLALRVNESMDDVIQALGWT